MMALEAHGLGKTYHDLLGRSAGRALTGIDLAIPSGERVALLGRNGSGKSTLLRLFATLVRPSTGNGRVCGHDIRRQPRAVRRRIVFVGGEGHGLDPRLTAEQNAAFRSALHGVSDRDWRAHWHRVAAIWELDDLLDRPVGQLSTGERQRLALAIALLAEPQVLLLDEPTRSLDPKTTSAVWQWLQPWPITILWASHDPDECLQFADRLLVLHDGHLVANGAPADVAPTGRDSLLRWYEP